MNTESVAFAAGILKRRDDLRAQADTLKAADNARFLPLWNFKVLIHDDGGLATVPAAHPLLTQAGTTVFVGLDDTDAPVFAVDVSQAQMLDVDLVQDGIFDPSAQRHASTPDMTFRDLKLVMTELTPLDAEIAATARAVLGWHKSHMFCAACGKPSEITQGGWQRTCGACNTSHFPRTDPVVIMLITHGNAILLGRSPHFPEGMYSLLAGFVEPGEPIEAAVRREVMEEAGVPVEDVSYITSQPWPFPMTLMIGCSGTAQSREIVVDKAELEDALWLSREDCASVMAGTHPSILPVRAGTIAHFLITKWLADR